MGLYPRKGVIAEGSDADLVLVDPEAAWAFSDASVASAYTLYGGATGAGSAVTTLLCEPAARPPPVDLRGATDRTASGATPGRLAVRRP